MHGTIPEETHLALHPQGCGDGWLPNIGVLLPVWLPAQCARVSRCMGGFWWPAGRWIGVSSPCRPLQLMDPLVAATHPVSPADRSTHLFRCCSYIQHRPSSCLAARFEQNCTAQTPSLRFECIPMDWMLGYRTIAVEFSLYI